MHVLVGGAGETVREPTEDELASLQQQAVEDASRQARDHGRATEKALLVRQMRQHADPVIRALAEHI